MRNPLIDNAKGVLIFLVVLGHYLEAVGGWDNPYLGAILSIIYLFHMPAFVFLTGVTAKKDRLGERIANLAIILVVFQFAYVVLEVISDGEWPVGLFQPFWILWFLLSLIWWTLLLPLIARVPYAFAISIVIAAVAGLYPWDGYQLSVMRTLTFLPFFVGGVLHGSRIIAALQAYAQWRFLAALIFVATAVVVIPWGLEKEWFYRSTSYTDLGIDGLTGSLISAAFLLLTTTSMFAFLACMTSKPSYVSVVGQNSLAVFVFHGFAVGIVRKVIALNGPPAGPWGLAFAIVAAVITTLVFAKPVFNAKIRAFSMSVSRRFVKVVRRTGP